MGVEEWDLLEIMINASFVEVMAIGTSKYCFLEFYWLSIGQISAIRVMDWVSEAEDASSATKEVTSLRNVQMGNPFFNFYKINLKRSNAGSRRSSRGRASRSRSREKDRRGRDQSQSSRSSSRAHSKSGSRSPKKDNSAGSRRSRSRSGSQNRESRKSAEGSRGMKSEDRGSNAKSSPPRD